MAMCSFSLESFSAVACRSKGGQDDVWLVVAAGVGARIGVASWPIGIGVQAGQGFSGPWSAGPYQAAVGETGVAAYTLVNLKGSSADDQETMVAGLRAGIATAVQGAGGVTAATEAAIRGLFGGAGELLAAPAIETGEVDCRGLMGLYVTPFTVANAPEEEVVETGAPIALTGTAPALCGTTPQSMTVFSVRRGPSLFSQSTPVAAVASATATMELFAVGMDGLVRYNARSGGGPFGAWQVFGTRTFSQSAALVALTGAPERKDVFGIGTDGVIYHLTATPETGWGEWSAVSPPGMFLPDTPVSAISLSGVLTLAAVDGGGVAQSITWKGDAVLSPWGPLVGMTFERRTPLLLMSHVDPWVEVFAVSPQGRDYHTSRANTAPTWGPWQMISGLIAPEPTSRRMCGLTFDVFSAPAVSTGLGMAWFRVDGNGAIFQTRWTQGIGWIPTFTLSLIRTIFAGPVSGVRVGDELVLYVVDTGGRIGVTYFGMPVPFNQDSGWGVTQLPVGPVLAKDRAITAVALDSLRAEVFVVDREGLLHHLTWTNPAGSGSWSIV